MTLYQEIELNPPAESRVPWEPGRIPLDSDALIGGEVSAVIPGSVAADVGIQPGDRLVAINNNPVADVIDVQYYGADESLDLLIERSGEWLLFETYREYNQPLGMEFTHPTFDTDIRRCNNLCEFCFVLQMAPRFRRTLYIKDDDYRYSFLFGHFVTLTNLSEHDWWRIEQMRLSPLYVSVHVTDLELRRRFLRNPLAPDIIAQLRWLAERGITAHTQLVVVPEFNDGPWLERSIDELAQLFPAVASISVVPVGLTRQHKYGLRVHTPEEAGRALDHVEALQGRYLERFGVRFVYPTDEWYLVANREVPPHEHYDGQELHENGLGLVRRFLDEWAEVKVEIASNGQVQHAARSLLLATGTLFAPTLSQVAAQFEELAGVPVSVQAIVNRRLGDTITTAGLLMAEDVAAQLGTQPSGTLVVLPRVMFDHPDVISLDDVSPQQMADRLGTPVALADSMGDVWDALLGVSRVLFYPDTP
jgi:putative radical SAM enzyme (TIGR03279 family)